MIKYDLREYKKLTNKQYQIEKYRLQVELLKLQEDVIKHKRRIVIVFEGRDSAGKTGTIQLFSRYLIPSSMNYINLGVPSKSESKNWFKRYERKWPKKDADGKITFFDRSWYNRALIEPTLGYCSQRQYKNFLNKVNSWEKKQINKGIELTKFYLSIDRKTQQNRLKTRKNSPIKYWKFSESDAKIISKYDVFTLYKEQMFEKTSTTISPWIVINANNKKIAQISAMHYILNKIDYENKIVLEPIKLNDDISNYTYNFEGEVFSNLTYSQYNILSKYLG